MRKIWGAIGAGRRPDAREQDQTDQREQRKQRRVRRVRDKRGASHRLPGSTFQRLATPIIQMTMPSGVYGGWRDRDRSCDPV